MVLAQYHNRSMGIRNNLIVCPDRRITGFCTGTPGRQDNMPGGTVIENRQILGNDDVGNLNRLARH